MRMDRRFMVRGWRWERISLSLRVRFTGGRDGAAGGVGLRSDVRRRWGWRWIGIGVEFGSRGSGWVGFGERGLRKVRPGVELGAEICKGFGDGVELERR